jgi:hypothetical protein
MRVNRRCSATVALFGLLTSVLVCLGANAQNNAASTTGLGSHAVSGTIPTGAVHPPTGPVQPPTGTVPIAPSGNLPNLPQSNSEHHHYNDGQFVPLFYGFPVPYAVNLDGTSAYSDSDSDDQDPNYQGGPTVFDRRGSGEDSYVAPVADLSASERQDQDEDRDSAPSDPPVPTTLVFKDGHKLSVDNYAIIGQTLLDLTPGHTRRVPLADLDLAATQRENDDRGIVFQVPETRGN